MCLRDFYISDKMKSLQGLDLKIWCSFHKPKFRKQCLSRQFLEIVFLEVLLFGIKNLTCQDLFDGGPQCSEKVWTNEVDSRYFVSTV